MKKKSLNKKVIGSGILNRLKKIPKNVVNAGKAGMDTISKTVDGGLKKISGGKKKYTKKKRTYKYGVSLKKGSGIINQFKKIPKNVVNAGKTGMKTISNTVDEAIEKIPGGK